MNTFVNTLNTAQANTTQTQNGMTAYTRNENDIVTLFYNIGAARNNPKIGIDFARAWAFDKNLAAKTLFWARDVRGGAGERKVFRDLLLQLEQQDPAALKKLIPHIPEFGRFDDLLIFQTREMKQEAYKVYSLAIRSSDGLAGKWAPRKGQIAVELRNFMNMSPKQYRKTIVHLSNTVEQKMCAQEWDTIEFGKLPSIAAKTYMQAFIKHVPQKYAEYKASLVKGEAKVNASAIFPHDVIVGIRRGDAVVGAAQWDALPNYLSDKKVLPMVDVSGSMTCRAGQSNVTCLDVAVALGLYVADKQPGAFNGMFLTFSAKPELIKLEGDILTKMLQMDKSEWGMNTDIAKAFDRILQHALNNNVPAEDMPQYMLIFSDMQFDQCVNMSGIEMIRSKYERAGYNVPNVVFWNLNGQYGNMPAFDQNEKGVVLVSGFSPAMIKPILAAEKLDPMGIVLDTINSERYTNIRVD